MWRHVKPILQVIILATAMLFPFPAVPYWKTQQISRNFPFSAYHNTKLQLSDNLMNTSTHTQVKWKILWWSKSKITACFFFFPQYCAVQKRKQQGKNHVCITAHHVVQTLYSNVSTGVNGQANWYPEKRLDFQEMAWFLGSVILSRKNAFPERAFHFLQVHFPVLDSFQV